MFAFLLLATLLFYMLEIAFKSFSRIALAGFLEDFESKTIKNFDFVEKYEMVLHALRGLTFFLQLILFIYSYILLGAIIPNEVHRIVILIILFFVVFNLFIYTLSFLKREPILARLILLSHAAWWFFYPINAIFAFFVQRNPENKEETEEDDVSEKELEVFFEEGAKEGVLGTENKEMIESVLEFGDTLVKEIMTPRVDMIYVEIDITLDDLVKKINEAKKSRYAVISENIDNIEGIILAKDVFDYWHREETGAEFNVRDILRPAFFIPETMRVLELLNELQKSKQKFAIVADEFGGIAGMVTMEDIIEEIVGEIHDEYDDATENIVEEKDHFIVKGDTDIYELSDRLNIKIDEDEDYQTVGGLISFELGKIPDKGDKVTVDNYTLQVMEMEKNRIKKIRITKKE